MTFYSVRNRIHFSAFVTSFIGVLFSLIYFIYSGFRYEIRTNPSYVVTPQTTELYSSPANCRESVSHWAGIFPIETGDSCPVNQYYYSGFVALQALLDYTKIRVSRASFFFLGRKSFLKIRVHLEHKNVGEMFKPLNLLRQIVGLLNGKEILLNLR